METPFPDGSADLESIRPGTDRSVCLARILPFPTVVLPDHGPSRHRHTGVQLAQGSMQVCIPPSEPHCTESVQIREDMEQVLMVAPYWPNQTWFSGLVLMVSAPPLRIPLGRDFLSQGQGTIWHPRPNLWNLHVWSLERKRRKSEGFYPQW